jgi:PAS domain-containing protein
LQAVIFTARDLRFRKEIEDTIRRANADLEKWVEERTTELAKTNAALRIENQARRLAENQLRDTVSLLNAALESTNDAILVVSNERKVTSCNQKFVEMWRITCDAMLGRDDKSLLAGLIDQLQNPSEFFDRVQELYADRTATSFDTLHFKDGAFLNVHRNRSVSAMR